MTLLVFTLAALSAYAATTIAQDAPVAKPPTAENERVCRKVVPTGSIMAKTICLGKTEWKDFASRNARHVDHVQDHKRENPGPKWGSDAGM